MRLQGEKQQKEVFFSGTARRMQYKTDVTISKNFKANRKRLHTKTSR